MYERTGAVALVAIEALDSLRRVAEEGPSTAEEEAGRVGGSVAFVELGVLC
jgi:hypothetical protein